MLESIAWIIKGFFEKDSKLIIAILVIIALTWMIKIYRIRSKHLEKDLDNCHKDRKFFKGDRDHWHKGYMECMNNRQQILEKLYYHEIDAQTYKMVTELLLQEEKER